MQTAAGVVDGRARLHGRGEVPLLAEVEQVPQSICALRIRLGDIHVAVIRRPMVQPPMVIPASRQEGISVRIGHAFWVAVYYYPHAVPRLAGSPSTVEQPLFGVIAVSCFHGIRHTPVLFCFRNACVPHVPLVPVYRYIPAKVSFCTVVYRFSPFDGLYSTFAVIRINGDMWDKGDRSKSNT